MRIVMDFRVPEDDDWQDRAESALRRILAEFEMIAPVDAADSARIMDQMTADMNKDTLENFRHSVRYVARDFNGPIASINVLRQGYLRVRIRTQDFAALQTTGQAFVTRVMRQLGPDTSHGWHLARCEIRERNGENAFMFASWVRGARHFTPFLFNERRAAFIVTLFFLGLALEVGLSIDPVLHWLGDVARLPDDYVQLGLRLGAPMLVSAAVVILDRYAQWLDQRAYRLVWSARQPNAHADPIIFEAVK